MVSLLSSLALVLFPLVRREPAPVDLQAEVDALKRELEETRSQRDRWETLARAWRARYETLGVTLVQSPQEMMRQNLGLAYQRVCTPDRSVALLGAIGGV